MQYSADNDASAEYLKIKGATGSELSPEMKKFLDSLCKKRGRFYERRRFYEGYEEKLNRVCK